MSTPLSQAIRQYLPHWTQGRSELTLDDLSRLKADPQLQGAEAAAAVCTDILVNHLSDLPLKFSWRAVLTEETLDAYERVSEDVTVERVERLYQDCLKRADTPKQAFPQGRPEAASVKQGKHPNCVLTSTSIALAQQRPEELMRLVCDDASGYRVQLPGRQPQHFGWPSDWEMIQQSCSYANGLWMTMLGQAAGSIGQIFPGRAIKAVTGSDSERDSLRFTSLKTTREKLGKAIPSQRIVLAGRGGFAPMSNGLTSNHCYAVLDFDKAKDTITIQDPAGNEPLDAQGQPLDGKLDGRFTLTLPEFKSKFSSIIYELGIDDPDSPVV